MTHRFAATLRQAIAAGAGALALLCAGCSTLANTPQVDMPDTRTPQVLPLPQVRAMASR